MCDLLVSILTCRDPVHPSLSGTAPKRKSARNLSPERDDPPRDPSSAHQPPPAKMRKVRSDAAAPVARPAANLPRAYTVSDDEEDVKAAPADAVVSAAIEALSGLAAELESILKPLAEAVIYGLLRVSPCSRTRSTSSQR